MSRPAVAFFEHGQVALGARHLHRVLLVPERAGGAPPTGLHPPQVLARLAGAEGDAPFAQRRRQLRCRPGAVLVQQLGQRRLDLLAARRIRGWTRACG